MHGQGGRLVRQRQQGRRRPRAFFDRYRRVLTALWPMAVAWMLSLAAALCFVEGQWALGAVLALAGIAVISWWRLSRLGLDRQAVARTVLAVSLGMALAGDAGWSWPLLTALVVIIAALMVEPLIGRATRPVLEVHGLPGFTLPTLLRFPEPVFMGVNASLLVLMSALVGLPVAMVSAVAVAVVVVSAAVAAGQLVSARRHQTERAVRAALLAYQPRYCLYHNGTASGAYQLRMWLPYLERTGQRGLIVVRDRRFFPTAVALGASQPVIYARSVESLEYLTVPSVGAFFYVNNDARNADGVRFGDITHVHLGHGDSDKPASYAGTTAMFDQVFVAGQAGVDRFAQHGVIVPPEKFRLVGRPQAEQIQVRAAAALPQHPVVLYAPTWRGGLEDSLFGSLRAGERIVSALLAAGAQVWFRPHPYSARDAESRVLISRIDTLLAGATGDHRGSSATAACTIFECFNASDALVTDVSSVASDYLYADKPFAITDTGVAADVETAFPLARAAVGLPVDGELSAPIADLLGADSKREVRAELRRYYLGEWSPQQCPEVFAAAAVAAMNRDPRDLAATSAPSSTGGQS